MTTNRELLDLAEKCGQPFGDSLFDCVCGRPAGHRPAKAHALSPTAGDLRRTLRRDVCGEIAPCAIALSQRASSDADDSTAERPLRPEPDAGARPS